MSGGAATRGHPAVWVAEWWCMQPGGKRAELPAVDARRGVDACMLPAADGRRGVNDSPGPIYDVTEHISAGGAGGTGWSMGGRTSAHSAALSRLGNRELALKRTHRS